MLSAHAKKHLLIPIPKIENEPQGFSTLQRLVRAPIPDELQRFRKPDLVRIELKKRSRDLQAHLQRSKCVPVNDRDLHS